MLTGKSLTDGHLGEILNIISQRTGQGIVMNAVTDILVHVFSAMVSMNVGNILMIRTASQSLLLHYYIENVTLK
jgi:hypothetical protein